MKQYCLNSGTKVPTYIRRTVTQTQCTLIFILQYRMQLYTLNIPESRVNSKYLETLRVERTVNLKLYDNRQCNII